MDTNSMNQALCSLNKLVKAIYSLNQFNCLFPHPWEYLSRFRVDTDTVKWDQTINIPKCFMDRPFSENSYYWEKMLA